MTAMELNSAVLLDEASHTPGSPQLGAEAVGHRSLEQQLHNPATLSIRQHGRSAGRELYLERLLPAALAGISPAHHRARCDVENAPDLVERKALAEQAQSVMARASITSKGSLGRGMSVLPIVESQPISRYAIINRRTKFYTFNSRSLARVRKSRAGALGVKS